MLLWLRINHYIPGVHCIPGPHSYLSCSKLFSILICYFLRDHNECSCSNLILGPKWFGSSPSETYLPNLERRFCKVESVLKLHLDDIYIFCQYWQHVTTIIGNMWQALPLLATSRSQVWSCERTFTVTVRLQFGCASWIASGAAMTKRYPDSILSSKVFLLQNNLWQTKIKVACCTGNPTILSV